VDLGVGGVDPQGVLVVRDGVGGATGAGVGVGEVEVDAEIFRLGA